MLRFVSSLPIGAAELYITFDEDGLDVLLESINEARRDKHAHLWLDDLTVPPGLEEKAFPKVTIRLDPASAADPPVGP